MTEEVQTLTKPTVIEALIAVMGDVQAVGKDGRNTQQNYSFRGIDAVVNAVGPVLRKHGVVALPHKSEARYRDVLTSNGKPSRECTVTVTYRFYGPAGDFIDTEVPGESMDFGDKGAPKAMSVAFRIALLQTLCIPTDDPEPDASSYERSNAPEPETGPGWLAQVETSIQNATSIPDLHALGGQIAARVERGQVSSVHREHLGHMYRTREGELRGAA